MADDRTSVGAGPPRIGPDGPRARPVPVPGPAGTPFWDALAREVVSIQRCRSCSTWIHYPRERCPTCLGDDLGHEEVDPTGILHSFTVARAPVSPHFADEVPLFPAIVELPSAGGIRLTTRLVDVDEAELAVGRTVVPRFDHAPDRPTLLHYTLADG